MVKNVNKCQKITNNFKISEITKYGEKITKIDRNVNKNKKITKIGQKRGKKGVKFKKDILSSFFWLETTQNKHASYGPRFLPKNIRNILKYI